MHHEYLHILKVDIIVSHENKVLLFLLKMLYIPYHYCILVDDFENR